MSEKNWVIRVSDILERIHRIQNYISGKSFEDLSADLKLQDQVGFNLVVIGEAARFIPAEIETEFPQIKWARMRGMRNRMAHNYNQIDLVTVWQTMTQDLAPMIPVLEQILHKYSDGDATT